MSEELLKRLEALESENSKLKKINSVLVSRVEASGTQIANPYSAFEHSVTLAEQVRERTEALNQALERLNTSHRELSAANQKAEQANLSKTKFLAAVSHDLLQPLNAARLFASTLEAQTNERETSSLLSSLSRSLDDVEALLRTLVDISKLDAGAIHAEVRDISVTAILDQLQAEFKQAAHSNGLKFKHHTRPAIVRSDQQLLIRMLRNLLTNAIRYTETGGILLSSRKRGDSLLIQVWDTGIGIEKENLNVIFEEFKRLPNSSTEERGLGLGLSIVEKMCNVLNHKIEVTSTPLKGSVFSIHLPLSSEQNDIEIQTINLPNNLAKPLAGHTLALIDNDPTICEAMEKVIESWGGNLIHGLDETMLRTRLKNQAKPELLIVDYHLDNGINGLTVADNLKDQLTDIPVLVVTANQSKELDLEIADRGYELMHKPVKPLKLRQLITRSIA